MNGFFAREARRRLKAALAAVAVALVLLTAGIARRRRGAPSAPAPLTPSIGPTTAPPPPKAASRPEPTKRTEKEPGATRSQPENRAAVDAIKRQMLAQLSEADPERTIAVPSAAPEAPDIDWVPTAEPTPPVDPERERGRKEREGLPLGVVLRDGAPVYADETGRKVLYRTLTGDLVRVRPDAGHLRRHVHPGLDVYLAATSRDVRAAGERLPDRGGWMEPADVQVFEPDDAKEFLFGTDAVTLGNDPSYSTLAFYDRAMKNPDPVVHRVVGPRLIALSALHPDYVAGWSLLIRDRDPRIRSLALATLRDKGVEARGMIDDLIARLAELTRFRAQGEKEAEALFILSVLRDAHNPHVPLALASFTESWKATQDDRLNASLRETIDGGGAR